MATPRTTPGLAGLAWLLAVGALLAGCPDTSATGSSGAPAPDTAGAGDTVAIVDGLADAAPPDAEDPSDVASGDGTGSPDGALTDGAASDDAGGTDGAVPDDAEAADGASGDASTAGTLTLDPATLTFFALPIDSIRYAVAGYDPVARACATLIWDYSNTGHVLSATCVAGEHFPYALVELDTDGPCGAWDYGASGESVTSADGCVDFAGVTPTSIDLVDVTVAVTGTPFTGTIRADNRSIADPAPVTLGLRYTTDVPENVWVQSSDALGLPAWVRVTRDGVPVNLFDRCDIPICGESQGVCGAAIPQATNITQGDYSGSVYLTWDGRIRVGMGGCLERQVPPPGTYKATFCFGWELDTQVGQEVKSPSCVEETFELPGATMVVGHADFGG